MKAKLFTLLTALIISSNVFSQGIHMGLQVTPAVKWLSTGGGGSEAKSDGVNIGFGYGVIADFDFTDNYSFGTGLQIAYKGGPAKGGKLNVQLVEVPVSLKMRTNEIGHIKYFGQFGLLPGYILSAKVKDPSGDVDKKDFNISLLVALGVQYNIASKTDLVFALQFNQGFSDVTKDKGRISVSQVGLMVGVIF